MAKICRVLYSYAFLLVDTPSGMKSKAWQLFPFYIGTIMAIMLRPMGEAPILMIFLGLYAVSMNGLSVALSGFSIGMVWLVTGAYFIAQAFRDTNLGRRIAYLLIRAFGRTSLWFWVMRRRSPTSSSLPKPRQMRPAPAASFGQFSVLLQKPLILTQKKKKSKGHRCPPSTASLYHQHVHRTYLLN